MNNNEQTFTADLPMKETFTHARSQNVEPDLKEIKDPMIFKEFMLNHFSGSVGIDDLFVEKMEEIFPQGMSFSHNVHVPIIEQMFQPNPGRTLNGDDAPAFSFGNFLSRLYGTTSNILRDSKTLLLCYIAICAFVVVKSTSSNGYTKGQKNKSLKQVINLQFFVLSLILMGAVTFGFTRSYFSNQMHIDQITRYYDHFWLHLAPEWQRLREQMNDEGIEMVPVVEVANPEPDDEGTEIPDVRRTETFLHVRHHLPVVMANIEDGVHNIIPQGIADHVPAISALFLSSLSMFVGFKVKEKFAASIINITKTTPMQMSNITYAIVSYVNGIGEFCKNIGLEQMSEYFHLEVVNSAEVVSFLNKANSFLTTSSAGEVYSSAYHAEVYTEILKDGEKVVKNLEKGGYEFRVVSDTLKKLRDEANKVEAMKTSLNGIRIEPVGILIKGKPGSMKSVLTDRLASLVTEFTLPEAWAEDFERDPSRFSYAVPNDKFFDSYNYKAWTVIADDLFQIRDVVGDPDSEAIRIIKMINATEYPLPMADIKDKNNVFFRSPFLFATTNRPDFTQLMSVFDTAAVERRFNINLSVNVSPKYRNSKGKTKFSSLPKWDIDGEDEELTKEQCTAIPNDFWEIKMVTKTGDVTSKEIVVTMEEVVKTIILSHHERIKNFYINREMERHYKETLRDSLKNLGPKCSMFSKMAHKTMIKKNNIFVPQSGLPGSYSPESVNTSIGTNTEDDVPFLTNVGHFDDWWRNTIMTNTERQEKFFKFFEILAINRVPIEFYQHGIGGIYMHLGTLRPQPRSEFLDRLEHWDGFCHYMSLSMLEALENDTDPFTGLRISPKKGYEDYKRELIEIVEPTLIFLKKHSLMIIMGGTFIIGSLYLLNKFIKDVIPNDEVIAQSVDLSKDRNRVGKPVKLSKNLHKIAIRPQAPSLDMPLKAGIFPNIDATFLETVTNASAVTSQIMNKYLFIIYIVRKVDDRLDVIRLGHAHNVTGKVFMMPMHFMYQLHDVHAREDYKGAYVFLTTATKSTQFKCTLEDMLRTFKCSNDSANNDLCLFEVASAHATSLGMLRHYLTDNDVSRLMRTRSFKARICGTYINDNSNSNVVRMASVTARFMSGAVVTANWEVAKENPQYLLENVIAYESDFSSGDCGSMITVTGNDFENRIVLGMHVAGSPKEGFSNVITQDNIRKLVDALYPFAKLFDNEEENTYVDPIDIVAQGLMLPEAKLKPNKIPGDVFKSELTKSVLFGRLPEPFNVVAHYPARLLPFKNQDGEMIDPGKKALKHYSKEPIYFQPGIIERAVSSYEALINENMFVHKEDRDVIPLEEALHAFRNVRGISPSTSPGFPMALSSEDNIKKEYYKAIEAKDLVKTLSCFERIANLVRDCDEKLTHNVRPLFIYKDCLKDEKRPKEKVLQGSTRLFSACPFILLVQYRRYFGAFMSAYIAANIKVGSAIGINPYSKDWDEMTRRLLRFNVLKSDNKIGAGDYSKFDTSEYPQVLWEILEMINRWYGKDSPENRIRSQLWAEIINSKHIYKEDLYDWKTGLPSGNPLTAMVNTIYNNIIFRISFQHAGYAASEFNKHVELQCLGDDNIFSVSPEIEDDFNELTLVEFMDMSGMVYTTEMKETATKPFRKITEVEFLKRSFRFDDSLNRWVAPLRLEAIFATLNWTKKGLSGLQITADELSSTLSELSLHGREVFNKYAEEIINLKGKYLYGVTPAKELSTNYDIVYSDTLNTSFLY